jgi:hypothetical protein
MRARLADLPMGVRLGVLCLCAVLGIGLGASLLHMRWHYEKRDERTGFTLDDLRGAYHGMRSVSPLVAALERGHPEDLPPADRDVLLDWLLGARDAEGRRPAGGNPRLSSDYDNPDLGERAPAEIMASRCLSCHGRASGAAVAREYPLDYWDDVKIISVSREISPTDPKKLTISIHAHAISLACMVSLASGLFYMTRVAKRVAEWVIFLACFGLLLDFVGQVVARQHSSMVYAIAGGGLLAYGLTGLMLIAVAVDVIVPARAQKEG